MLCCSYEEWYYDRRSGQCRTFLYSGCLGNGNRFPNRRQCEETCGGNDERRRKVHVCHMPKKEGACKGDFKRYRNRRTFNNYYTSNYLLNLIKGGTSTRPAVPASLSPTPAAWATRIASPARRSAPPSAPTRPSPGGRRSSAGCPSSPGGRRKGHARTMAPSSPDGVPTPSYTVASPSTSPPGATISERAKTASEARPNAKVCVPSLTPRRSNSCWKTGRPF